MAEELECSQQEFRVGLLVVGGFLAVVILILISDSISFDSEYQVTAYMENAAGLRQGSPVELSGIKIGEIQTIQASSREKSPGAIKAVLRINHQFTLYKDSKLTIGSSGIFGDSFLSFTNPQNESPRLKKDDTEVVVAVPGFMDEISRKGENIVNNLARILNEETSTDIKRLLKVGADAADETHKLVATINASSERITSTLKNVDEAASEIKQRSRQLGEQSSTVLSESEVAIKELRTEMSKLSGTMDRVSGKLENALASFDEFSTGANELMGRSRGDIEDMLRNARSLSSDLRLIASDLRDGKGVLGKLMRSETLAKDVDKAAVNIQNLSERLADHPEILIFGDSDEGRREAQIARERREQRRAFNEGYGSRLGTKRPDVKREEAVEPVATEVIE